VRSLRDDGEAVNLIEIVRFDRPWGRDFPAEIGDQPQETHVSILGCDGDEQTNKVHASMIANFLRSLAVSDTGRADTPPLTPSPISTPM